MGSVGNSWLSRSANCRCLIVVLELNGATVRHAVARGVNIHYADASAPEPLEAAGVPGAAAVVALLSDPSYRVGAATVSPDGRWLAYVSNESGAPKVYVRTFPDTSAGKWQVSSDFATTPKWSADGHQLYFVDSPRQSDPAVAVVDIQAASTFSFSRPRRLFNLPPTVRGGRRQRCHRRR